MSRNNISGTEDIKPPLKDDPNLIKNMILGVICIAIVSVVLFWVTEKDTSTVIAFLMATAGYISLCTKEISPEKKGVKVTLWTPSREYLYTGGLYWRWFLFQWFYLFPTEQVIIDVPEQEVLTERKTINEEPYSAANVWVDAAFYFFWPDTAEGLCDAYKKAPNPYDMDKLYKFFTPSLATLVRRVAGRFSWIEVQKGGEEYVDALHQEIAGNKNGPVVKAGITDFSVENKKVKLPEPLEEKLSAEQQADFELKAGKNIAELDKIKRVKAGEGDAEARRLILEAMEGSPEMAKLLTLQEMAQGDASTIFFELPAGLKDAMSGTTSDKIPDELRSFWQTMPEELRALWKTMPKAQRSELLQEFVKSVQTKKK